MSETLTPRSPWASTTPLSGQERLVLDADCDGADDPTSDLSAAARYGDTLFLGSDEGVDLERLRRGGSATWTGHRRLSLDTIFDLDTSEEADIEGLAEDDGWLWVLGSHARTRPKIGKAGDDRIDLRTFAGLKDTRPRCLLARAPLAVDPATGDVMPVRVDGDRRAGMVRQTGHGNRLARMMKDSPLLKPFTRIAAKEGGVDLEGIAVAGGRVAIGMRGPVIQTYAVLLEVAIVAKASGRLKIAGPLHNRLLELDGLGIRDLKRDGADLLILAGPTTGLDGPCAVYRWTDWLRDPPQDDQLVRRHRPERILDLPFGRGDDHPEGLVLLDGTDGARELLVICDSPAADRLDPATRSVRCDRFRLPDKHPGRI